jgi:ABC-type nitrate/sulfonate/bicarbonate transport system substrate-binding protein
MTNWRTRSAVAAAAMILGVAQAPATEMPITVMVFPGISSVPLLAAQSKGFFARHGLRVDVKFSPNSEEQRQGLAEGRFQIIHTAADNALAMADIANVDIAVVMGGNNGFLHLYAQPEIRSYEDLRGKTVVVDAPDTAFALVLYKMLLQNGLKRGDYAVKAVGGTTARLEAMLAEKSNAVAIINQPFAILAARAGLKEMGSPLGVIGPYQSGTAVVLRSWAQANADVLVRYLRGYIEAQRWVLNPSSKDEVVSLLVQQVRLPQDVAAQTYDILADPVNGLPRDAAFDMDGFKNVLKLRAEIQGQWGGTPPAPDKYIDLSYYQRALAGL